MSVPYELVFVDDHPDCGARYGLGDAPCLVTDDRIVYHGRLSPVDLEAIFAGAGLGRVDATRWAPAYAGRACPAAPNERRP